MRLRENLQRRTVGDHENGELLTPTKQFWYEQALNTIWWDLDLLRQSERVGCNRSQKRCHWLKEFNERVAVDIPAPDGALPFQLWESSGNQVVAGETQYLNHNIASSLALYTYLARSIDRCKGETAMEFFMSSLNKLVPRVCS